MADVAGKQQTTALFYPQ